MSVNNRWKIDTLITEMLEALDDLVTQLRGEAEDMTNGLASDERLEWYQKQHGAVNALVHLSLNPKADTEECDEDWTKFLAYWDSVGDTLQDQWREYHGFGKDDPMTFASLREARKRLGLEE